MLFFFTEDCQRGTKRLNLWNNFRNTSSRDRHIDENIQILGYKQWHNTKSELKNFE